MTSAGFTMYNGALLDPPDFGFENLARKFDFFEDERVEKTMISHLQFALENIAGRSLFRSLRLLVGCRRDVYTWSLLSISVG